MHHPKPGEGIARPIENNPLLKHEISSPEIIEEALKIEDLTADGSTHAINIVRLGVQRELEEAGFPNIHIVRDSPIVSVADNFDKLLFPADNMGRSSVYTRYVDSEHVLRTHTSASVPSLLEHVAHNQDTTPDDVTFILPGMVYRRDVSDRTHLGEFHQMDVWRLVRNNGNPPMDRDDLLRLVEVVFRGATPGKDPIVYEANHPYTVDGIEVYARFGDQELEVLEAGLINPAVLAQCGLNPNEYSGLALGMGLDRLVMTQKSLGDIRLLRAENPKIASQMHDMLPFREVSRLPAATRDLSYAVGSDSQPEDIAEAIRRAFGEDAYLIEEVDIKSETALEDVHANAQSRLGILPGQKNVLVRVTLRHPDRTLNKQEINAIYSRIYPCIHEGSGPGYI